MQTTVPKFLSQVAVLVTLPMLLSAQGAPFVDAPDQVLPGEEFTVAWSGPGGAQDFISLAHPGDNPGFFLAYDYAASGSPATLVAPTLPGTFVVRYVSASGDVLAEDSLEIME